VRFRHRLDPVDSDWREADTRRQAFYTNLAPGKYSFRVMACNSDGVWNESATTLALSVAPAFYQTLWFRALFAALFFALLWAAYRVRIRHLRRDSEKLRDVVETIPAIVFEAGPDGSGAFANRRWLEYTGSSLRQHGKFVESGASRHVFTLTTSTATWRVGDGPSRRANPSSWSFVCVEPTGSTGGSWRATYRCATSKEDLSSGLEPSRISKIRSRRSRRGYASSRRISPTSTG